METLHCEIFREKNGLYTQVDTSAYLAINLLGTLSI